MAKLSDNELVSICEHEIDSASGYTSGELASERAQAMDRYLGKPLGDEKEGRSQVVSRDTTHTVESIMPQLMRIFADVENLAEFDPVGPEDEEAAQQESDRVNHAFWKENDGFHNLYTFCKDALLSKNGILKCWWQDGGAPKREEYKGLNDFELAQLIQDTSVEREVLEWDETENGIDITFQTTEKGKVMIEPVTPEEFGINRDARSPHISDGTFVYHRVRKTYGELLAEGYSKDLLDQIPTNDDVETAERLARRHLADESDVLRTHSHPRMRTYWVTECYLHIDRDDDGIPELLKVTLATGAYTSGSGARLLDVEEVDEIGFYGASPVPLTHKFYGLSVADLVMDIEKIKTTLLRQILDNTYLANNGRTHINKNVNLDDLLTRRPGGVVRHKGEGPVQANMAPEPFSPLPPQTFGLMEYLDGIIKDRTGSSEEVPGLDTKSLANINSGVAAIAYDQARARIELIARILAEVGLKPLLKRIHALLQQNQDKEEVVKLRGQWVPVNPSEWRERKNMTIQVGLGIASRERRLVALDAVAERQAQLAAGGGFGTLIMPKHIYAQLHDHAEALGVEPSSYYQNPDELPPKPPEGPSVQDQAMLMTAQAQLGAAQAQNDKNKVEMAKAQAQFRIATLEQQGSIRELELKRQTEVLKADLKALEMQRGAAESQNKAALDAEIKLREQSIKVMEARMNDARESDKQEIDMYKAFLQSGTQITVEQMKLMDGGVSGLTESVQKETVQSVQDNVVAPLLEQIGLLQGRIEEMRLERDEEKRKASEPIEIKRNADGLIETIGGKRLNRNKITGLAESIG